MTQNNEYQVSYDSSGIDETITFKWKLLSDEYDSRLNSNSNSASFMVNQVVNNLKLQCEIMINDVIIGDKIIQIHVINRSFLLYK